MGKVEDRRASLNLRIDPDKYVALENRRRSGFGVAQTNRNRSDVYNEALGYGLQTLALKEELGDRDFEKVWQLLHKLNLRKLNLDKIVKMVE